MFYSILNLRYWWHSLFKETYFFHFFQKNLSFYRQITNIFFSLFFPCRCIDYWLSWDKTENVGFGFTLGLGLTLSLSWSRFDLCLDLCLKYYVRMCCQLTKSKLITDEGGLAEAIILWQYIWRAPKGLAIYLSVTGNPLKRCISVGRGGGFGLSYFQKLNQIFLLVIRS